MKRFLFLFCAVVLVCSIMILPAFASESLVYSIDYLNHSTAIDLSAPLEGLYIVNFYDADHDIVLSLPAKDFTYPNTVSYGEGSDDSYWWEMSFYYMDDALMLETSFGGCTDDDCGTFNLFYPDVSTFELVPYTPVEPEPDPEPLSPLGGIGEFFSSVMLWLSSLASVVLASPVLTVFVACFVIVGFVVALGKRLKS